MVEFCSWKHGNAFVPPGTSHYLPESYVGEGPWVSHRGAADTPHNTNHCLICCRKAQVIINILLAFVSLYEKIH